MRNIKLRALELENFKCFKHKEVKFGDKATVKGRNAVGKSTLLDAVLFLLFDKSASGDSATGIRPHDVDGNDIHFIDISVAGTFEVDGREITLKKVQKENWVKPRGQQESVFKGNENTFEVNGIPKKQADYKVYVAENFCDEETFLSCTNAQSFFRLDVKKRRAKLLSLAGTITDADVVASDKAFEPLADMLRDGTVDELISRSKGTIKRLNDELKTIPARIDEQEHSKVELDFAELELAKKVAQEKVAEIEEQQSSISKRYEEYQKASDDALEIKFEMSDLETKANEELFTKRRRLEDEIASAEHDIRSIKRDTENAISRIEQNKKDIASLNESINKQSELWNTAKKRKFDESSLVCAYCGQEYPQSKKDDLGAEFEAHKAKELDEITQKGNAIRKSITKFETDNTYLTQVLQDYEKQYDSHNASLEKTKAELAALPEKIDVTGSDEYKSLATQLANREELMKQCESLEQSRKIFTERKQSAQAELDKINLQLAQAQRNIDIDSRVEELHQEQIRIAQRVADQEKLLDLLERFNRAKMNALTKAVNKHFKIVRFKLFDVQINGGVKDICKVIVDGTDYESGLNHGSKILADLDLLNTFQSMNNIHLPIFADDTESVDSWRLPEMDTQTIYLRRTDDEELIVTGE